MEEIHRGVGASLLKVFRGDPRLHHVRIPGGWPLESAMAYYETRADVQYVQKNLIYSITDILPNDPSFDQQWNWLNVGQMGGVPGADVRATTAWDKAKGRFTVVVASIDTGVDYNHPDLALNIWTNPKEAGLNCANGKDDDRNGFVDDCRGWNFVGHNNNPLDDNNHGTHTSGIIGARTNNALGVAGANWDVQIMPVKVFDSSGSGFTSNIIEGIDYAVRNGAVVLNNSWGMYQTDPALQDAIERANQAGALFVAAAGNDKVDVDGLGSSFYPCAYPNTNVVCVAATDVSGNLSYYSNYGGTSVDMGAPGDNILSTIRSQGYDLISGTSMATPHVTGAVALLKGCKASLISDTIRDILISTARPSGVAGMTVTGGIVDYEAALNDPRAAGEGGCDAAPYDVPPEADAGGPYKGNTTKAVQFNGSRSSDSDGRVLLHFWDFGDGSTGVGARSSHQYASPGTYNVTLTVRDNLGAISTATTTVTIRSVGRLTSRLTTGP
jgi:subtilisin family serine protease